MNHGSLFSGIGGFDLSASWMGWENVFHCEWNEFGQRVLKYYFPESISYGDITKTDFTIHRGQIDVLSGGFPCQPFSVAGNRKGTEDSRHLWPEMLRAIREIQPKWIVGENVPGIISWSGGLVFEQVCADLEAEGYEVQPVILPAVSVDAPHRRDRVWFVAHSVSNELQYRGLEQNRSETEKGHGEEYKRQRIWGNIGRVGKSGATPNPFNEGLHRPKRKRTSNRGQWAQTSGSTTQLCQIPDWRDWPTQPPVRGRTNGLPSRLAGITVPKHRNESIKAYGNAIVPQVVYQIFKAIEQISCPNN